ncbi:DUF1254 domain-containing protein [Oricola indica]|jgi:uncharacterized membrane protein|uniref:DUF1254 domain-containing protein n=1 Tax=Oricola indica TaxID=2872591 RepID=UPI001CBB93CE|nr:hypothetical protein [Oricola indica]
MGRIIYATLVGLVGAALVHLAVILMLPQLSENDVWRQVETRVALNDPVRLDRYGVELAAARTLDPMFAVIACRYDLSAGIFSITAPATGDFWSVAVFDDLGRIRFSANDRIVATENLDLVVAQPLQMRILRQSPRPELADAVMAETNRSSGFVVLRIFRPDETYEPVVREFIDRINCNTTPI